MVGKPTAQNRASSTVSASTVSASTVTASGVTAAGVSASIVSASGVTAPAGISTEELLQRYRLRRSRAVLDRIVELNRNTVETMALTMAARLPRSVDVQDLVHAGMWGMMQAVTAYQPERCDRFESFLRIRVRGAMLDELRHMDFLPRLFRRRVRERDAARARLRMQLEREPTFSELAEALGISEHTLLRCPNGAVLHSVDQPGLEEEGEGPFEQLADDAVESPIEALTRQELLEQIRQSLSKVEWKVLQLHYLEGLTGRQVARRLRLSASRICQIHVQVLDRLKTQLTATAV